MRLSASCLCSLLIVLFGFIPTNAKATPLNQSLPASVSTGEQIAMALFKYGGGTPNFISWAKGTEKYKYVPLPRQNEYIIDEVKRLEEEWTDFEKRVPTLYIRTKILASLHTNRTGENNTLHTLQLSFEDGSQSFFPVVFQGYKIALIPDNLKSSFTQELSEDMFVKLYDAFGQKYELSTNLWVELKPFKGYLDAPQPLNGDDRWVLMAKIVGLSLENPRTVKESIWDYSADWYISPSRKGVLNMYQQQQVLQELPPIPQSP